MVKPYFIEYFSDYILDTIPLNHALMHNIPSDNPQTLLSKRLFFGALAIGIVARIIVIFFEDFWLDELWSSSFSNPANSLEEVLKLTLSDVHPPLYQVLLYYWYQAFGFYELSGRALSSAFGLVAIGGFHLLANSLYKKTTAQLATILFALNSLAIIFCAEVRSYELLLMLSIFSSYFFFEWALHKKQIAIIGYVLFSTLAIYTHYFGVILLLCHGLLVLIYCLRTQNKEILKQAVWVYLLLVLCFSPLLQYAIGDALRPSFWIKQPSFGLLLVFLIVYFGGPAAPIFLTFLGFAAKEAKKHFSMIELLLLVGGLSVLFIPYLIGFISNPMVNPRNIIIGLPFWLLLSAFIASFLSNKARTAFIVFKMLVAIATTVLMPWYKGEQIDGLLKKVAASQQVLYIVNGGKLDTAEFMATKLAMNKKDYGNIELRIRNHHEPQEENYWLICYHTCNEIDLNTWLPEHYTQLDEYHGRGIKGLQIHQQGVHAAEEKL